MSKQKTIKDFLPKQEPEVVVQVKLPQSFFNKVNKLRQADQVTWHDLIVASFAKYLTENGEQV